jgi:hypothetical protein
VRLPLSSIACGRNEKKRKGKLKSRKGARGEQENGVTEGTPPLVDALVYELTPPEVEGASPGTHSCLYALCRVAMRIASDTVAVCLVVNVAGYYHGLSLALICANICSVLILSLW